MSEYEEDDEFLLSRVHDDEFENFEDTMDEDKILSLVGYKKSTIHTVFYYLLCICSCGMLFLVFRWFPLWQLKLVSKKAPFKDCDSVLLTGFDGSKITTKVKASSDGIGNVRFFIYRHIRYVYDDKSRSFVRIRGIEDDDGMISVDHESLLNGLNSKVYQLRKGQYGLNEIDIEIKSYYRLLVDEVLHPFYVFQIFSAALWVWEAYYIYAVCIFAISIISVLISLFETRRNMVNLHEMASYCCELEILRNGSLIKEDSLNVVPGDIFVVPESGLPIVPCDCVLIDGSCIVNESCLTGESVPVTKLPLSEGATQFCESTETKSVISCGTSVVQTRARRNTRVVCMVLRTGFDTVKGSLVRSILYPKPDKFKFYEDAFKFVLFLSGLAIVGTIYSVIVLSQQGVDVWEMIPMALDVVTIVVPPALPAAMTVGTMFAISRLKLANIYCIQPTRVNVSGKINLMVFDKTGTLTEDGLDVWGVIGVTHPTFDGVDVQPIVHMEEGGNSLMSQGSFSSFGWKVKHEVLTSDGEGSSKSDNSAFGESDTEDDSGGTPRQRSCMKKRNRTTSNNSGIGLQSSFSNPHSGVSNLSANIQRRTRTNSMSSTNSQSQTVMFIARGSRFLAPFRDLKKLLPDEPLTQALGCCHSLITIDGKLIGDPIDLRMFEAVGWELDEMEIGADSNQSIPTVVRPPESALTHDDHQNFIKFVEGDNESYLEKQSNNELFEYGLVRQFPFSSKLQRMSVIMQKFGAEHLQMFLKGAPEMVKELCVEESVPPDFHEVLEEYTREGYRCLALATKTLDIQWHEAQKAPRQELECDFRFVGFLVMQNRLKPETKPVIQNLTSAEIRSVMCTGDNLLTAISVGRECEIVVDDSFIFIGELINGNLVWKEANHKNWSLDDDLRPFSYAHSREAIPSNLKFTLAINGTTFEHIKKDPYLLQKTLPLCCVYARMSPDHKTSLVELLEDFGYTVGMCGDGANDCGALKAANVGISLSDAEASVAAPFTSKNPNIECIPKLIREGRAALMTSFAVFKYMALYSFIQFASILILYWINSNLGDTQFLYADMIVILPLSFLMGRTGAYRKLKACQPPGSLISCRILISLFLQIAIQFGFQFLAFIWLLHRPWYTPLKQTEDEDANTICMENTVVFYISSFQYITTAVAFSDAKPFRKRIYSNGLYLLCIIVLAILTSYLLVLPHDRALKFMGLVRIPYDARMFIGLLVFLNFLFSVVLETYILPSPIFHPIYRFWSRKKKSNTDVERAL